MKAPVIVFAYNRKEHLKRTLDALSNNIGASESEVFVFVDKAPENSDESKNNQVKDYLKAFEENHKFSLLRITYAKEHRGLAASVIAGVTEIVEKYERVIVLEDDIVTSDTFLNYMNDALDFYEDKSSVWSISGYTMPLKALENYKEDVYIFNRCCSWGWATWKDRWQTNDWDVKDYKQFKHNIFSRYRFNHGGNDLSFMLDRQMLKMIDSWAIRWGYNESKAKKFTIYPSKSFVINEGCDGTGTHFASTSNRYKTDMDNGQQYQLIMPKMQRDIAKEFHDRYSEPGLKHFVKEVLYCLGLYKVK